VLCYKKDGPKCHRFILKQLVENPAMLPLDVGTDVVVLPGGLGLIKIGMLTTI
jgi:hypothetical protein